MSVTIPGYERFTYRAAGGFSQVYEAYQISFSRMVAVKILTVTGDEQYNPEAFKLECRAMGVVSAHPNIVTVLDSGFTAQGQPYIAMELYQESLLDRIRAARFLPLEKVLQLGVLMASALHAAHEASILHRDIKPQNIFYSRYGDPALGDFGIASLAHDQLTDTAGALTEHYAAPEVLDGAAPTRSSDVYSLGATLYAALAGRQPFARPEVKEPREILRQRIISDPVPLVTAQPIPERQQELLFTLLAKHPNDRPWTALAAGELLQDIQRQLRLDVTPLRQAAFELPDDTTRARLGDQLDHRSPVSGAVQPRLSAGPAPNHTTEPDEDLTGETVDRDSPDGPLRPAAGFRIEPRTARGAGLLAAVTVAAALGWMLLGRGRPQPAGPVVTLPTSTSTRTIVDTGPPARPTNLASSRSASVATVTWDEVPTAEQYRVEFVVGGGDPLLLRVPAVEIDLAVSPHACVTVAAVNDRGQISPPTEPYCPGESG
ncbi:MAG: serine/threonine-protein kinase [Acidimicrobiales bacterium]